MSTKDIIHDADLDRFYGEYERPSYRKVIGYCDDCQDEIYEGDTYYLYDNTRLCDSCVDDDFMAQIFRDKFDRNEKMEFLEIERVGD